MKKKINHHLIFEGAELSGKSFIMSEIYNFLEKKYNQSKDVLDGCHWINADIGIFGTPNGKKIIHSYLEILKTLINSNVIIEKFHISDSVYSQIYKKRAIKYNEVEKKLHDMSTKIVFLSIDENTKLVKKRLQDRIRLYPHYKRIAKKPEWYLKQQALYRQALSTTKLPFITVDTSKLPNKQVIHQILNFIGEN